MSPEQAQGCGKQLGPHSDLWAVGALLFVASTGTPVHGSVERAGHDVAASALRLETVFPEAPAWLTRVVDRALQFRIDARWQTATQMRDALRERAAARGGAPPSSPVDSGWKSRRTSLGFSIAFVTGCLFVCSILLAEHLISRSHLEISPAITIHEVAAPQHSEPAERSPNTEHRDNSLLSTALTMNPSTAPSGPVKGQGLERAAATLVSPRGATSGRPSLTAVSNARVDSAPLGTEASPPEPIASTRSDPMDRRL